MPDFNCIVNGNSIPASFGAVMYDSSQTASLGSCFIYTSVSDISNVYVPRIVGYRDVDDYYAVMPGYKLIVYLDPNYTGTTYTIDNTNGTNILVKHAGGNVNKMSSCKLYFRGTLLNELT